MKKINIKSVSSILLPFSLILLACCQTACKPKAPAVEDLFYTEDQVAELTKDAKDGKILTIHELIDQYMTEEGNYMDDSIRRYRTRAHDDSKGNFYLFSIDTLPSTGEGIYIKARVETDDEGGNFYKTIVLQQIVDGQQQNIRIGIDAAAISGLYPRGQEVLIRCNGLAIGRYANQIQLCTPSYNNNVYANKANEKAGWAPGRIDIAQFKSHSWRIGMPDASKLQVDVINITDFNENLDIKANRKMDGRLVRLEGVHFTGQLNDNGSLKNCTYGNPDLDPNANVFAPTTENMNYPQSRAIADIDGNWTLVSVSEYAKCARYYIPGAGSPYDGEYQYTISKADVVMPEDEPFLKAEIGGKDYYVIVPEERVAYGFHEGDVIFMPDAVKEDLKASIYTKDGQWVNKVGILHCEEYIGSVTGVLSFYKDNARYDVEASDWSISICDMSDIDMKMEDNTPWNPIEYTNKNK